MTPTIRLLLLLLIGFLSAPCLAETVDPARSRIDFGPVPSWVEQPEWPDGAEVPAASGLRYLLVDDQWNAALPSPVSYRRLVLEIVDRAYILHDGKVLMSGTTDEVVRDETVRRVYLGENFRII